EGSVTLAVTGGGFVVEAGERRLGSWHVVTLRAGEQLVVRRGTWGAWAYVAFAGDLDCPRWLGSASTLASSGLGGGVIRQGLEVGSRAAEALPDRGLPCPVFARPRNRLHIVPGPQERCFTPEARSDFLRGPWSVSAQGDRMG